MLLIFEVCFEDRLYGNGGWGQPSRCFHSVKMHRKGPAGPAGPGLNEGPRDPSPKGSRTMGWLQL